MIFIFLFNNTSIYAAAPYYLIFIFFRESHLRIIFFQEYLQLISDYRFRRGTRGNYIDFIPRIRLFPSIKWAVSTAARPITNDNNFGVAEQRRRTIIWTFEIIIILYCDVSLGRHRRAAFPQNALLSQNWCNYFCTVNVILCQQTNWVSKPRYDGFSSSERFVLRFVGLFFVLSWNLFAQTVCNYYYRRTWYYAVLAASGVES